MPSWAPDRPLTGDRMGDIDEPFDLQGVSHLALVCSDMARTVDFYTRVLDLRLIKTIELPSGMGQHFFFDIGNGDSLAFFCFPDAPPAAPGIAAPAARPDNGDLTSAVGSMNHIALQVAPDRIEEYRERLVTAGRRVLRSREPRRQQVDRQRADASRSLRAIGLLPGPGRDPPRAGRVDQGARARRRAPRTRRRRVVSGAEARL